MVQTTSKSSSKGAKGNLVSDFGRNEEKSKFSTEMKAKDTAPLEKMFQVLSRRSFRVKR